MSNYFYRVAPAPFCQDLSGEGAKLFGGRWNKPGQPALYAAGSRSLAILEFLAHVQTTDFDLYLVQLSVPAHMCHPLKLTDLPKGWQTLPAHASVQFGNQFLQSKQHLAYVLPSVLVPEESNVLINPLHPHAKRIKIEGKRKLNIDFRLAQRF